MALNVRLPFKAREPRSPDGTMPLFDHLRELRNRIALSVLFILLGTIVAWFFYDQLFDLLTDPFYDGIAQLGDQGGAGAQLTVNDIGGPLIIQLKVSALAGAIATSPLWLWQIWAFITPGLHPNERKWSAVAALTAGPLFILGVAVGYYVLPKGVEVLLGFTPDDVLNLPTLQDWLSFSMRMLLVFGVAFEIPLFVIALNAIGIVRQAQLARARPWIIVAIFVFAAVGTPSTDPFSMLFLAVPMLALYLISELVTFFLDRRRYSTERALAVLDDDEASPLDLDE